MHAQTCCGPVAETSKGLRLENSLHSAHQSAAALRPPSLHLPASQCPAPPRAHLGAQGDLHRIRQLLHALQQPRAALVAKPQVLGGVAARLQLQRRERLRGWMAGTRACECRRRGSLTHVQKVGGEQPTRSLHGRQLIGGGGWRRRQRHFATGRPAAWERCRVPIGSASSTAKGAESCTRAAGPPPSPDASWPMRGGPQPRRPGAAQISIGFGCASGPGPPPPRQAGPNSPPCDRAGRRPQAAWKLLASLLTPDGARRSGIRAWWGRLPLLEAG